MVIRCSIITRFIVAVISTLVHIGNASTQELLNLQCDGGLHLFQGYPFEMHWNISTIFEATKFMHEEISDRAKCACPSITDEEIQRRFVPSLESLFVHFVHEEFEPGKFRPSEYMSKTDCPNDFVVDLVGSTSLFQFDSGLIMPETCTYESITNGKGCKFIMRGQAQETNWLYDDTDLHIKLFSCGPGTVIPSISVKCVGSGCDSFFHRPCAEASASCRKFWGKDKEERKKNLVDLGLISQEDTTNCFDESTPTSDYREKMFAEFLNLPVPASMTNLLVEGRTFAEWIERIKPLFTWNNIEDAFGNIFGVLDEPFNDTSMVYIETELEYLNFDNAYCTSVGCHASYVGDGMCHPACNDPRCMNDDGDCDSCDCLNGRDYSTCAERSEFFQRDSGTVDDTNCAVRAAGVPPPDPPFSRDEYCTGIDIETPKTKWVCLDQGVRYFQGPIPDAALGVEPQSCEDTAKKIRNCFCGQKNACFDEYRYVHRTDAEACGVDIMPLQVCPSLLSTAKTSGFLIENNDPTDNTFTGKVQAPLLQSQESNVLYTTCEGDIGINLFNNAFGIALRMPNVIQLSQGLQETLFDLYSCYGSPGSSEAFLYRYGIWSSKFWIHSLFRSKTFGLSQLEDGLTVYDAESSYYDWFSNIGQSFRDSWFNGQVVEIASSTFSLESLVEKKIAKGVYQGIGDLIKAKFDVQVSMSECKGGFLPKIAIGIDSPVGALFSNPKQCSVDTDCPNDSECFDLLGTINSEHGYPYMDANSLEEVEEVFSFFLKGTPKEGECTPAAKTQQSMNRFILKTFGNLSSIPGPGKGSLDVKYCWKSPHKYLYDTEDILKCEGLDEPTFEVDRSSDCEYECGELYFGRQCITEFSDYSIWRQENLIETTPQKLLNFNDMAEDEIVPYVINERPDSPLIKEAKWEPSLVAITVSFDVQTNSGGVGLSKQVPCIALKLEMDNDSIDKYTCEWTSPSVLRIILRYDSTFSQLSRLGFAQNNGIRTADGLSPETPYIKVNPVLGFDYDRPVIKISGPSVVSPLCTDTIDIHADAISGSGGRPLSFRVIEFATSYDSYESMYNSCIEGATRCDSFGFESDGFDENYNAKLYLEQLNVEVTSDTKQFVGVLVSVRNWVQIEESQTFLWGFELVGTKTIVVDILGATSPLVISKRDTLSLTAKVEVEGNACVDQNNIVQLGYQYRWTIVCENADFEMVDVTDQIPELVFTEQTLVAQRSTLPTGNCEIAVEVTTPYGVSGMGKLDLVVELEPILAVVNGGARRILLDSEQLVLDGSKSCDPNIQAGGSCISGVGSSNGISGEGYTFEWICTQTNSESKLVEGCTFPCEKPSCDINSEKLVVEANVLKVENSPYTFTLNVTASARDSGIWTETLPVDSSKSNPFVIDVISTQVTCERPTVDIAPIPTRVNAVQRGITLRSKVSGEDLENTKLLWQQVVQKVDDPDEVELLPVNELVAPKIPVTRNDLVIAPFKLSAGSEYRFRLTAIQDCTNSVNAFGEISFTVNRPPRAGRVVVTPQSGKAVVDEFVVDTFSFTDEDNDFPLRFSFEYTYKSTLLENRPPISLSDFVADSSLTTTLSQHPDGESTIEIFAIARDALGAESKRSASFQVTVLPPFLATQVDIPFTVEEEIAKAKANGKSPQEILRLLVSCGSVANGLPVDDANTTANATLWDGNARREIVLTGLELRKSFRDSGAGTPRTLALEASSLLVAVSRPASLSAPARVMATQLALELVQDIRKILARDTNGSEDPNAASAVPVDFAGSAIGSISYIAEAAKEMLDFVGSNAENLYNRRLETVQQFGRLRGGNTLQNVRELEDEFKTELMDAANSACESVSLLRSALEELGDVVLFGASPGQIIDRIDGNLIRITAARETPGGIGQDGGVTRFGENRRKLSNDSNGEALFVLPPKLLSKDFTGSNEPTEVNILAIEWDFDVRCDNSSNTFENVFGELPEFNECDDEGQNIVDTFRGPLTTVESVVSLDFLDSDDITNKFSPQSLEEVIQITIPISNDTMTQFNVCQNSSQLTCGYYAESVEEGTGWITRGCNVSQVNMDEGYLVCECNHASDYSAWQAFVEDVTSTISDPLTTITTLAIITVALFIPLLILIWYGLTAWAKFMDRNESDNLQRGALLMLLLNRTKLQNRQRKFFAIMKAQMEKEEGNIKIAKVRPTIQEQGSSFLRLVKETSKQSFNWCKNWILAIKNEHSIIGLRRFDPHYTRVQRVSVFIAVVVGNMFVAAIFYELKTADDITDLFVFGVIIVSSFVVGIPIKFLVKVLFRGSAKPKGSKMERAAQILRIAESGLLASSTKEDLRLVVAYKELYKVKNRIRMVHHDWKDQNNISQKRKAFGCFPIWCCPWFSENNDTTLQVPKIGSFKINNQSHRLNRGDERNKSFEDVVGLTTVMSKENMNRLTLEEYQNELDTLYSEYQLAKKELNDATVSAREIWKRDLTPSKRKLAIKRQKSMLLKMAALVGEDDPTRTKFRKPKFPSWCIYAAWCILMAFYIFSVLYIIRFVLTRSQFLAEKLGPDATQEEIDTEEAAVLRYWFVSTFIGLIVSYFFVEPFLQFIRFTVLPMCIVHCGHTATNDEKVSFKALKEGDMKTGVFESTTEYLFDFASEVVEGFF